MKGVVNGGGEPVVVSIMKLVTKTTHKMRRGLGEKSNKYKGNLPTGLTYVA